MTCMRARTSSNFGLIGPPTAELNALECLEKKHKMLIRGNMVYPLYLGCSWSDPFHICNDIGPDRIKTLVYMATEALILL